MATVTFVIKTTKLGTIEEVSNHCLKLIGRSLVMDGQPCRLNNDESCGWNSDVKAGDSVNVPIDEKRLVADEKWVKGFYKRRNEHPMKKKWMLMNVPDSSSESEQCSHDFRKCLK